MRWFTLAAALFSSQFFFSASAANLRITTDPVAKAAKPVDKELAKVQLIERSLQTLAKQAHAPNGTADLLNLLSKAEGELKAAGSAKEKRSVMNRVNAAMKLYQSELMKKQLQLKKDGAADELKKVSSLSSIAKKLQDRLDRLNKQEKDVVARVKDREAEEAKLQIVHSKKQSKEDLKTQKLLQYFAKKNKREVKKKLASWALERKALTDAIGKAKSGDAEGTRAAMEKVMHAEKGDQDFLH